MTYYIAVFFPAVEGGYTIRYPDLPEALSQGDGLEECMTNAGEILALTAEEYVKARRGLPVPSTIEAVTAWAGQERDGSGLDSSRDALYVPFPVPEMEMTPVRVTVSIAKSALEAIDRKARSAGMTRSGFLAAAAQSYTPQSLS